MVTFTPSKDTRFVMEYLESFLTGIASLGRSEKIDRPRIHVFQPAENKICVVTNAQEISQAAMDAAEKKFVATFGDQPRSFEFDAVRNCFEDGRPPTYSGVACTLTGNMRILHENIIRNDLAYMKTLDLIPART